ncbi:MAG TPA: hypothetical protein VGW78_00770 [Candidatus Babeliales bacterium]|jgi:zinc transporter ZupT|nr:hypothetical protein [Candidatus Babeliales bacterium]
MKQIHLCLALIATTPYIMPMSPDNQKTPVYIHSTNDTVVLGTGYVPYKDQLIIAADVIKKKNSNHVSASTFCAMAGSLVGFCLGHLIMLFAVGHGASCHNSQEVKHYYEHDGMQISAFIGSIIGAGIGNRIGSLIDQSRFIKITDNDIKEYKKQLDAHKKD